MSSRSLVNAGLVAVSLSSLSFGVIACGDEEQVAPASGGGAPSSASVGPTSSAASTSTSSGAGGEGAGTPIRTILQRDPFGNVAETQNLLWDGDFEWESAFADQYGWFQGQSANLTLRHLGPDCRSGLKCAVLGPDIIGLAVSSADRGLYVSAWIRPSDGSCEGFRLFLLSEGIYSDGIDFPIPAAAAAPDDAGWCHFEATAPQRDDKSYLFISSTVDGEALVDDAVVREATDGEEQRVEPRGAWVPSADVIERVDAARQTIRRWRGPHEGAPHPGRDAMQRASRGDGRVLYEASPRTMARGAR